MKISFAKIHVFIVFIIIVGSVFIDLLNGYLNYYKQIPLPVGVAFRTVLTLFILVYAVIVRRIVAFQLYICIVFLLWVICNVYWIGSARHVELGLEISLFVKIIFPLLLVCYLYYAIENKYITLDTIMKFAVLNGVIAGLFIVFSFVTGIGLNTYSLGETGKSYGFGTTSFFKAQNDVSLQMLISLCFAMYYLFKTKKFWDIVKAFIIVLGLFFIGTRAGLLGALLIVFVFTIYTTFFVSDNTRLAIIKKLAIFFLVIIVSIVAAIFVIRKIEESPYMLNKYTVAALSSARVSLTDAADTYINKNQSNYFPFVFGSGNYMYTSSLFSNLGNGKGNEEDEKTAEQDWVDLRGGYGTLFALVIFFFPVLTFIIAFKYFIGNIKDLLRFSMLLAITLFIFHSVYAGHGIKNPGPGTLLAILYLYPLNSSLVVKKDRINS